MGIPDELAARMPLAYVHFTHLLVDALLLLAPFALYAKLGAFAIILNGIIALFYRGLLELSKSFLEYVLVLVLESARAVPGAQSANLPMLTQPVAPSHVPLSTCPLMCPSPPSLLRHTVHSATDGCPTRACLLTLVLPRSSGRLTLAASCGRKAQRSCPSTFMTSQPHQRRRTATPIVRWVK